MNIIIDGKSYQAEKGQMILDVCRANNIEIPTLCHDERLKPYGGCRMCIVEVEGKKTPQTSCSTLAKDGMVIRTKTEKLAKMRYQILDMLFSNHPNDCLTCFKSGECKLQDYCYEYGVGEGRFRDNEHRIDDSDDTNRFFIYDSAKCINCGICVRTCEELQQVKAISFKDRGFDTTIGAPFGKGFGNSDCVSCGNCVSNCPVGALKPKTRQTDTKHRVWETKKVQTTCSYCGVGCQLNLVVKDNEVVEVKPVKSIPNDGLLCVKGKFAYHFINHPDRLRTPLIKKNGEFVEASWDEAYRLIKEKSTEMMEKHGTDGFAGFSSARCTNEENYLFQKLIRTVFKTNNVDHCARL